MNQLPAIVGDPARGLSLVLHTRDLPHHRKVCDANRGCIFKKTHPFGLDLPQTITWGKPLHFIGEHVPEMSVENFIAAFIWNTSGGDRNKVKRLRVINVPHFHIDRSGSPWQRVHNGHYVFFELWPDGPAILSGETTDFSGAGREGCQQLEDIFALLSLVYKIAIERVTIDPSSNMTLMVIERLYSREEN